MRKTLNGLSTPSLQHDRLVGRHVAERVLRISWRKFDRLFIGDDLGLTFRAYRLARQQISICYRLLRQEAPQKAVEMQQLHEYIDYLESLLPSSQRVERHGL